MTSLVRSPAHELHMDSLPDPTMRSPLATLRHTLLLVVVSAASPRPAAAEPAFHVYVPVKETKQLLVIAATPGADGLDLAVQDTRDVGCGVGGITGHPTKPLLYLMGSGGRPHQVKSTVLELDAAGAVAGATPFDAARGCVYARTDPAGKFLLTADYGSGGVDVYPLDEAGLPGTRAASRDEDSTMAHSVGVSPDGRFVYVPHVKQHNVLFQYALDRDTGTLSPLDPPDAAPAEGIGPRHVAFHPTLPVVYFTNEQQLGVSAYTRGADGRLASRGLRRGRCRPGEGPQVRLGLRHCDHTRRPLRVHGAPRPRRGVRLCGPLPRAR